MIRANVNGAPLMTLAALTIAAAIVSSFQSHAQETGPPLGQLKFGGFVGEFADDGGFRIEGRGWPTFLGTWRVDGAEIELRLTEPLGDDEESAGCDGPSSAF